MGWRKFYRKQNILESRTKFCQIETLTVLLVEALIFQPTSILCLDRVDSEWVYELRRKQTQVQIRYVHIMACINNNPYSTCHVDVKFWYKTTCEPSSGKKNYNQQIIRIICRKALSETQKLNSKNYVYNWFLMI